MKNTGKLKGKTIFITGASRGIGKAIALKAARDGANIVIAAKTAEPHPKLPGTIYTAAAEIEEAGGRALACIVDVRDERQVQQAVTAAIDRFGGIDILINNASAISKTPTLETDMKRYDLMQNINTRGTFLVTKACLPHLLKSANPHILNLSPPLNMDPKQFAPHTAYTMAKYGMSMCVLGWSEELRDQNVSVNALWPQKKVHTAAIDMLYGPDAALYARKADIMADAAYTIICRDAKAYTGHFFIDEEILKDVGFRNFSKYSCYPEHLHNLQPAIFMPDDRYLAKL
ncbi:hypothetical protein KR222_010944 [Zaprionus bogoriensis]|nr:hypothetical protein KR222_010944 [Zaprionus bogoriensis]